MTTNNPTSTWKPTRQFLDRSLNEVFRSLQNWLARPKFLNGITLGKGTLAEADQELLDSTRLRAIETRLHALDGL